MLLAPLVNCTTYHDPLSVGSHFLQTTAHAFLHPFDQKLVQLPQFGHQILGILEHALGGEQFRLSCLSIRKRYCEHWDWHWYLHLHWHRHLRLHLHLHLHLHLFANSMTIFLPFTFGIFLPNLLLLWYRFYILARGAFVVPKTRLAMLPVKNEFTKDHATVEAHVAKYGAKPLPHVMSKLVHVSGFCTGYCRLLE